MLHNLLYNHHSFSEVRPHLCKIWREAFGDSEQFIETFFDICVSDNVLHTLIQDGRVVSALYALPYKLCHNGVTDSVAYIYAVATDSEFRGKGFMRHLMTLLHKSLRASGYSAALLLPATRSLANYYASMGYKVCAYRKSVMLAGMYHSGYIYEKCALLDDATYNFIVDSLSCRKNNIIHPKPSLAMNAASCALSGGGLFLAKSDGAVAAVAFVTIEDGRALLLDIFASDSKAQDSLVAYLCNYYAVSELPLLCCDENEGVPFAMVLPFDSSFPDTVGLQLMLDR